ncbi:MAG: esterase [Spirochaetota bacterium]
MRTILTVLAAALSLCAVDDPVRREIIVDGVTREALVYTPVNAGTSDRPLVFVFHGHGGTMQHAANSFDYHRLWPEAIVVYPQGLNTPGKLTDPQGKKSGWQSGIGAMGDRDLKFFDAMYALLKEKYRIDKKRVYATGHSNGGGFTYLLWATRGDILAAVAPMAALLGSEDERRLLTPKPAFHCAGKKDPLVKYAWQEMMMQFVRDLNGCTEGKPGANDLITIYPSAGDTPFITYIHNGGHEMPKDAIPFIVQFFKDNAKR